MLTSSILYTPKNRRGFSVYVDLFNKGEFNEVWVIPNNKKFTVFLDDKALAVIEKKQKNNWVKVEGNIPHENLEQVVDMINLKLDNK